MLGEVAQRQALALAALATEDGQLAGEQLDQGRLAGAVASQQADALARPQREIQPFEHRSIAVAGGRVLELQQGVGRGIRLTEGKGERGIDVGRRDQFHPLQRLDPALRLAGLGGLGAKALDEAMQVRALALLALVQGLLLGQALGANALEGRVAARVQRQAPLFDVGDVADHRIEEVAIVGDQQQGAGVIPQPLFEPDHRIQVEVVGRLVEQQQVRATHQRLRQIEPHPPATGERGDRPRRVALDEAEPVEQGGCPRRCRIGVDLLHPAVQQADRLAIVIGLGSGQFALDPAQFAIAVQRVVDRTAVQRRRLLGDMGHLPGRRHLKIALVLVQLAAQQREQARLAAAIGSGQTDLPARVDLQVHIFEKHLGGAREAQLPELDHGGTDNEAAKDEF